MNKIRIKCLLCTLLLIFSIVAYGCGEDETSKDKPEGYEIYYLEREANKLAVDYENIEEKNASVLVEKMLSAMMNPKNSDDYVSVLNNNVKLIDYSVTENIVYLNFTTAYSNQSVVDELLCRAAFVLTLTQIEGVDFVGMNINGQPLIFKNNTMSLMKASDFADISEDSIITNSMADVTLYFANKDGKKLKATKENISFSGNSTLEKCIVETLIKGPSSSDYKATIPKNVTVLDAFTRSSVCYVYFDSSINDTVIGVDDDIMIYSIVNSLSELTYISKVQIIIDGDPSNKLHDSYNIDTAFSRNLDLVEENK